MQRSRKWRRRYYDFFSHFYDGIIALHSKDKNAYLRRFLLKKSRAKAGDRLLDICTGTGAVALTAARMLGIGSIVVGVDFSLGMLKRAIIKTRQERNRPYFIQADVTALPFPPSVFNVVTCSHAMYELAPHVREKALSEARRVLVSGGCFIMMEHCKPLNPFVRLLYNIRLASMGSRDNRLFAQSEIPFLTSFFNEVTMEISPTGRSKVVYGYKGEVG